MALSSDPLARGLISRFESIKGRVQELEVWSQEVNSTLFMGMSVTAVRGDTFARFIALVKSYEKARLELNILSKGKVQLEYVDFKEKPSYQIGDVSVAIGLVETIVVNCDTALGYLEASFGTLTKEVIDELNSLKSQIAFLDGTNPDLHKHLVKSIQEQESGHFLSSALLAGKVVDYVLSQLPGKSEEDKIAYLVERAVLETKLKDDFFRGVKKARNYYTHDLRSTPEPQEALGILSTACDIAIRYSRAK